jgi:hypothetical protein
LSPKNKQQSNNKYIAKIAKRARDRAVQQAFNDLLLRKHVNGGKLKFGDMIAVINNYWSVSFLAVTRRNLRYRLELYKKTSHANLACEIVLPAAHVTFGTDAPVLILTSASEDAAFANTDTNHIDEESIGNMQVLEKRKVNNPPEKRIIKK